MQSFSFDGWSRIVDYRYSMEPLSVAGSVKREGGRFNIGSDLSPAAFPAFPALYLAEDYDAALRERFAGALIPKRSVLSVEEFALRSPGSFTQVRLQGSIENVIDIGDLEALKPFAKVLSGFPSPKSVFMLARKLGLRQSSWVIRSPVTLQRQLLHANWRMLPQQFDLPSNSQIFGRIAVASGLHGILYPSARQAGKRCLALFPQNWANGKSFVEVADDVPAGAAFTRIDGQTKRFS